MWQSTIIVCCLAVLAAVLLSELSPSQSTCSPLDVNHAIRVGHAGASGTIYLRRMGDAEHLWSVDPTTGRPHRLSVSVTGEPSRNLHNGQRWFLTTMKVPGGEYANGHPRRELFAVSEAGRVVQLTDRPDLEPLDGPARWPIHGADRLVSWMARHWKSDGRVDQAGVYVAQLRFDDPGNIVGLGGPPISPRLNLLLAEPGSPVEVIDACGHDWSPDGKTIVYETGHQQLWIARLGGTRRLLTPDAGYDPTWASDGSAIAFRVPPPSGALKTVRPDGTPVATIEANEGGESVVYATAYSPDAKLLAYARLRRIDRESLGTDICLKTPQGDDRGDVILDLPPQFVPVAWR